MSHTGQNVAVYLNEEESDEDRRHRRKHKKKHRSRHRSRSSSSSPAPSPQTIHVNPIIANTIADAQMLQQRVATQDMQMHHMGAELASAHARINILEGQLSRLNTEKVVLEARCTPLEQQNARLIEQLDETKKVLQVLEPAVTSYQKANENLTKEKAELMQKEKVLSDELKAVKAAYQAAKEQADFVSKRNEVLANKCEELLPRAKQLEEENRRLEGEATRNRQRADDAVRSAVDLRRRVEAAEKTLSTLVVDKQALVERECVWRGEKAEMEKKIIYKESQIRTQKRQHEDDMYAEKEKYRKLEEGFRKENASFASDSAIISVKTAMDIMRGSLDEQVKMFKKRLGEEIEIEVISANTFANRAKSPSPIDRKRKK